jgi:uncharacterized protein YtpQ (UPF0354 family)
MVKLKITLAQEEKKNEDQIDKILYYKSRLMGEIKNK